MEGPMGTWDEGLLDNDTASDGLGDVAGGIVADIQTLGANKPDSKSTARLAAAVGLLLQLEPFYFSAENERSKTIVAALKAHEAQIAKLPPHARAVLDQVVGGKGEALAERPAPMNAALSQAVRKGAAQCFGLREEVLFATEPGAAYVQEVANRCVKMVEDVFADEDNWSDLCREGYGMGGLAPLLVLEPCRVPRDKIEQWRSLAKKGLAELEEREDDELDFHRPYHANLDIIFAALLKRFS
jgi:hypothetical protein